MKKPLIIIIVGIGLFAGAIYWSKSLQSKDPSIISRSGIHWHPIVEIYVAGVKEEIPANVGLGAVHQPLHTHVEDAQNGVIHMEFDGLVKQEDTELGNFFKIWGKDLRSFGGNLQMTVNGKENTEFENYHMKEGDKIELRYE